MENNRVLLNLFTVISTVCEIFRCKSAQIREMRCKRDSLGFVLNNMLCNAVKMHAKTLS